MTDSRRASRSDASQMQFDRMAFCLIAFCLTVFGLVMIYSASSIMSLTSAATNNDPAYYLKRQAIFALIGVAMAIVCAQADYHVWSERLLKPIWGVSLFLLALILMPMASADAYGATRWIAIGPFHLQPSEFAKAAILLASATVIADYAEDDGDLVRLCKRLAIYALLPLILVLMQPDKGTVLIVGVTVAIMFFLAGAPMPYVVAALVAAVAGVLMLAFKDEYSRARIMTMLDPWRDPYNSGYQLIQGFYAFGSGGLTGVGLGMSRQKYSYLPMAHNDFIFAVVGEELGLVGTLGMVVGFLALAWFGIRIARSAPDLSGRLIAAGSVSMLIIQLLVNACGVLGIIPLSGKPIPFMSYGGSSIMSTMLLVGLVVSVSRAAQASSGSSFVLYEGGPGTNGFRVIQGGANNTPQSLRASQEFDQAFGQGRVTMNANGSRRINLGPSASERLRGRGDTRGGRG